MVKGAGNPNADIMCVGQNPGRNEVREGRPFVGAAGKLLRDLLHNEGIDPETVWYTNAYMEPTEANRKPTPAEIKKHREYLRDEISFVGPGYILALGDTALHSLTGRSGITAARGEIRELHDFFMRHTEGDKPGPQIVPTFHPAFALRVPKVANDIQQDIRKVVALQRGHFREIPIDWEFVELCLSGPPL